MIETIEIYVHRPVDPKYWENYPWLRWYGSKKQLEKKEPFQSMYHTTWARKAKIPIKQGETKHVRITFEEIQP